MMTITQRTIVLIVLRVWPNSEVRFPGLPQTARGSYFPFAELADDEPCWMAHTLALSAGQEDWRRLLFQNIDDALAMLAREVWTERYLYVMLSLPVPSHSDPQLTLLKCDAVWRCEEPDGGLHCWRIDTSRGSVLQTLQGTELGHEQNCRLIWEGDRKADSDIGRSDERRV